MNIRLLFDHVMRCFNFRIFCWVSLGVLAFTTVWERLLPRVYESASAIQFLRSDPQVLTCVQSNSYEVPLSGKIPVSEDIELENIVRRMSAEDRSALLRPYTDAADAGHEAVERVLRRNFRITPKRLSLLIIISYRHPSPEVALKMADLFMEECLARHFRLHEQETARRGEELDIRCRRQARVVEDLERQLENAKTHRSLDIEAYERSLAMNRELLGNLGTQKIRLISEPVTPPLRIVDRPVLAQADEYMRHPIIGFVRWRLVISALVGLLAALIIRRKATAG